jgi:hypothetical protein
MRENRTYGSEGGEAKSLPYPYLAERTGIRAWGGSARARSRAAAKRGIGVNSKISVVPANAGIHNPQRFR